MTGPLVALQPFLPKALAACKKRRPHRMGSRMPACGLELRELQSNVAFGAHVASCLLKTGATKGTILKA